MRTYRDFRNDFSAGVVSKEYLSRTNTELSQASLRTGDNTFITQAGTLIRRPGSVELSRVVHTGRMFVFDLPDGSIRHMVARPLALDIYAESGVLEQTLTAPWTADNFQSMTIVNDRDRLIFVSSAFWMQEISLKNGSWSLDRFEFRKDPNTNRVFSPFTRFVADGVTVTLGAYSGTGISVQFSSDILTPDHVGVSFLYGFGAQFIVTSVIDGQNGTADIIDRLFPTVNATVLDGSVFSLDDAVFGDTSQVRGIVREVTGNTIKVVLTNGYGTFDVASNETIIGPFGQSEVQSVTTDPVPSSLNIWFEELISDARGYPTTGAIHRNRFCLAGFPQSTNLFTASAVNSFGDFDIGDGGDNDAIIEPLGDDPNVRIKYITSVEQLLLHTDRGLWYANEGGVRAFTPSSIEFNISSTEQIGDVPPVRASNGVIFIDDIGRCNLATMTGSNRAPWRIQDLSRLGYHLIKEPKQLVYAEGIEGRPEKALFIVNTDGTMAVFNHSTTSENAGWLPWYRGAGVYSAVSAWRKQVYILAQGLTENTIERASYSAVMDGEFTEGNAGSPAYLMKDKHVLGNVIVPDSISIGETYGHDFPVIIEPSPYVIGQAGRQRMRASKIFLYVIDTGLLRLESVAFTSYRFSDNAEDRPPVNDREVRHNQQGSKVNRVVRIEQKIGEGAPLHLRSVTFRWKAS